VNVVTNDLRRQIEMTMADMGYEPPRNGESTEVWMRKLLDALLDLQRRLS
jgi:hypothetical protein